MSEVPPPIATDRECLKALAQRPAEAAGVLVARYLSFVYSSALRRTGDAAQADEVARAVFLVLGRRGRKLRTVLAAWLFDVTAVACRKLKRRRRGFWHRFRRKCPTVVPADASLWARISPEIDRAVDRLSPKQRSAILLCGFLRNDFASAAQTLRSREQRVEKRWAQGLRKLARRMRKHAGVIPAAELASVLSQGGDAPVPGNLAAEMIQALEAARGKRPALNLARRTLSALAWARWRRRLAIGVPIFAALLAALGGIAWHIESRSGHSRLIAALLVRSARTEGKRIPGLAQPARHWPTNENFAPLNAASVRGARDIYQTTNIWLAHLKLSGEQWKALEPKRVGALPNFLQSDGSVLLRNPRAQRSGVAGVLGFDFNWTHADFEFGGIAFTNVGVRLKGNGTWIASLYGNKRSFKVDLNEFVPRQKLAGLDELNFNNLIVDQSFMSDALAYEFFRDAGVPAPRTAYAWLRVSVTGKWREKPLGLYALVEPVDELFTTEHFGSKKAPTFKPVTYQLFEHLGDDWTNYAAIYDLKTKATSQQQQRVIEFSRLVSFANDAEFARRAAEYLDLDQFARFLAAMVLLSSYDSVLANGQNFYVYLDPRSNKFGFIPWDLDLAWGAFFLLGTTRERERASIWHPWVGENRFIERVMTVEEFRRLYRSHLEDFLARLFVAERLHHRIDELAAMIRGPIAAESDFRLNKFEQAMGEKPIEHSGKGHPFGADRTAHDLKRFIEKRAASVREQLDGKSNGVVLKRSRRN